MYTVLADIGVRLKWKFLMHNLDYAHLKLMQDIAVFRVRTFNYEEIVCGQI